MAYLALYRKYRPQIFDEVYGQEHITKTLINQIKTGRVSHAYLFTGTRGVGKTTVARIFAKAMNCLEPEGGNPCGRCAVCRALTDENLDILELDGASNNGVDQVREIRDNVIYPPTAGKYKVYIIDEVHMLTTAAFNALLKTLEEPPSHAVFILCTTEAHKIPGTILSRCMRFDFRLVGTKTIAMHLKEIMKTEGKECEDPALYLIAEKAQGSVRDALSLADRCMNAEEGTLTYDDVCLTLGTGDIRSLRRFACAVVSGNAGEALRYAEELLGSGRSAVSLAGETAEYFRDMLLAKETPGANDILNLPDDTFSMMEKDAVEANTEKLVAAAEIFGRLEGELRYSGTPGVIFEAAAVRASRTGERDIYERISDIEKKLASGDFSTSLTEDIPAKSLKLYWATLLKRLKNVDVVVSSAAEDVTDLEMAEGVVYLYTTELTKGLMEKDRALSDIFAREFVRVFGNVKYRFAAVKAESEAQKLKRLKDIADGKLEIE